MSRLVDSETLLWNRGWFLYRWLPSTILSNLANAWWVLRRGLRNWWRYRGAVWWQPQGDFDGMMELLAIKLYGLAQDIARADLHVGDQKRARKALIAAHLAARLSRDACEYAFEDPRHKEMWMVSRPTDNPRLNRLDFEGPGAKTNHLIYRIHDAQQAANEELLWRLLAKHWRGWWV